MTSLRADHSSLPILCITDTPRHGRVLVYPIFSRLGQHELKDVLGSVAHDRRGHLDAARQCHATAFDLGG